MTDRAQLDGPAHFAGLFTTLGVALLLLSLRSIVMLDPVFAGAFGGMAVVMFLASEKLNSRLTNNSEAEVD